jgi:hypothetical protein
LFSISHLGVPVLLKIFIFLGIKNWWLVSDTLCLELWEQGKGIRKRTSTRRKTSVLPKNKALLLPLTPTKVPWKKHVYTLFLRYC